MSEGQLDGIQEPSEARRELGADLRRAREKAGMGLDELARLTRIAQPFIEALERGEFHKTPGEVFCRGFIRSVCQFVGCPSAEYVERFNRTWGLAPVAIPRPRTQDKRRRGLFWTTAAVLAALVAAALWFTPRDAAVPDPVAAFPEGPMTGEEPPTVVASSPGPAEAVPAPTADPDPDPATKAPALADGQGLVVIQVREAVRISHRDTSERYRSQVYEPGEYRFPFAGRAEFYIYDLTRVNVIFNGEPLAGLADKGIERKLTFVNGPLPAVGEI